MKKKLMLGVCIVMLISLCGCGKNGKNIEAAKVSDTAEKLELSETGKGISDTENMITIEEEAVPAAAMPHLIGEAEKQEMQEDDKGNAQAADTVKTKGISLEKNPATQETAAEPVPANAQANPPIAEEEPPFDTQTLAEAVMNRVNEVRSAQGLGKLTTTSELLCAANIRAAEVARKFSHQRPGGQDFSTALEEAGVIYTYTGENVFFGLTNVQGLEQAWNGSAVHLQNITDGGYGHIGVGCVKTDQGVFLVQLFTD